MVDGQTNMRRFLLGAASLALMAGAQQAGAQSTPPAPAAESEATQTPTPSADAADIVITARRRDEGLQKTPIAIAAFSGDTLSARGVSKTSDLQALVPGLSINGGFGASNPQISLRGVGNNDYNDAAQATVGFYVDDVPIAAQAGKMVQTFDLQNIQVLKGPQGTLFGRNNTSGAILFTSRKPDGTTNGYADVQASSWNTFEGEGAFQFPISQSLSARFSGKGRMSDGYGTTLDATGNKVRTNGRVREFAGRGIFHLDSGDLTGNLILNLANADNDRPPFSVRPYPGATDVAGFAPISSDVYTQQNNLRETEEVRTRGAFLNLDYDTGPVRISSISGYWYAHRDILFDIDHSPFNTFHLNRIATSRQYSQELRIASPAAGRFTWVAGVFYLHEDLAANARYGFSSPTPQPNLYQNYTSDTDTAAVFAEGIYKITPQVTFTAGARYTLDKRALTLDVDPLLGGFQAERSQDWKKPTWRAILDYKPSDEVMFYASVSRGFQGGGYFGGSFTAGELQNGFGPEYLTAYEAGIKTQLLDRKLTFNASGFYYDYKDPQVFAIAVGLTGGTGFVQTITNADKARVKGIDADLTVKPVTGLNLNFNATYLDAHYGTLVLTNGNGIITTNGNRLINAPTLSFQTGADYTIPVSIGSVNLQADYSYKSRQYLDITERRENSSAPYGVMNARIALRTGDWEFAVFARNLLDKRYLTYTGDLSTNFGFIEQLYGAPQSFGGQVRVKF